MRLFWSPVYRSNRGKNNYLFQLLLLSQLGQLYSMDVLFYQTVLPLPITKRKYTLLKLLHLNERSYCNFTTVSSCNMLFILVVLLVCFYVCVLFMSFYVFFAPRPALILEPISVAAGTRICLSYLGRCRLALSYFIH